MKDELDRAILETREKHKLDGAHLSLQYFNESDWSVIFNGESYTPPNYAEGGAFVAKVVNGGVETLNDRLHREALELAKKKNKKVVEEKNVVIRNRSDDVLEKKKAEETRQTEEELDAH